MAMRLTLLGLLAWFGCCQFDDYSCGLWKDKLEFHSVFEYRFRSQREVRSDAGFLPFEILPSTNVFISDQNLPALIRQQPFRENADAFFQNGFGIDTSLLPLQTTLTKSTSGTPFSLFFVASRPELSPRFIFNNDAYETVLSSATPIEYAYILYVNRDQNGEWGGVYGSENMQIMAGQSLYFGFQYVSDVRRGAKRIELFAKLQSSRPEEVDMRLGMFPFQRQSKMWFGDLSSGAVPADDDWLDGAYDGCLTWRDGGRFSFSSTLQSPARPGLAFNLSPFSF